MPQLIKEGEYATVEEAATITGVSATVIRANIRSGKLSRIALGPLPYYLLPMHEVDSLKRQRIQQLRELMAKVGMTSEAVSDE